MEEAKRADTLVIWREMQLNLNRIASSYMCTMKFWYIYGALEDSSINVKKKVTIV